MDTLHYIRIYGYSFPESTINGEVPVTEEAEHEQELQQSDYIQLSWKSLENIEIPAGSHISFPPYADFHEQVEYTLLNPYKPKQEDGYYVYTPQFHAPAMTWKKVPFFFHGQNEQLESEWELTADALTFMEVVARITGYEIEISEGLPTSAYVKFSNTDTFSALNAIANAFGTEWYVRYKVDKTDEDGNNYKANIIYLGRAEFGWPPVILKVGDNINIPSVSNNDKEGSEFYSGYYVYGGTQNIDQSQNGGLANGVVNKRLTLSNDYPNSYYKVSDVDIELSKILYFDNIYPRAANYGQLGLPIGEPQVWIVYETDEQGNRVQIGGSEKNPVYAQKAYYFFKIIGFDEILGDTPFSEFLIEGMTAKGQFESGALNGWEFELEYISEDKQFTGSNFDVPFDAEKGMFRIENVKENNIWVPGVTGLVPQFGDYISLINIKLPSQYVDLAKQELKEAAEKKIAELQKDYNNYTFASNPVAFAEDMPGLSIGQSVLFKNGDYELVTRVLKLVTKLDLPCYQTITLGNKPVKGTISTLKEEVANANYQAQVLYNINKMIDKTLQAYLKSQEEMQKGFARINQMWQFDDDGNVYSPFGVYSKSFISARGVDDNTGGSGGAGIDLSAVWDSLTTNSDSFADVPIDLGHIPMLPTSQITNLDSYVRELFPTKVSEFFNDVGYITSSAIANKADKATSLAGYGITDSLFKNLGSTANSDVDNIAGWGVITHNSSTNGLPTTYGTILQWVQNSLYSTSPNENGWYTQLFSSTTSGLYYRRRVNGGSWSSWREFAFTDSNVSSATKLQNSRTIWGRSFDGTANVTGAMSGVTSINSLLNLNSTGLGIGVTSPNYKLDVNGTLRATGSTFLCGAVQSVDSGPYSLAIGANAYAYGNYARAIGVYSYAGVRTGNENYPYAYIKPFDTLAFTVGAETVYGQLIAPNTTLTYTYNGTEYSVTNSTNYVQVLTLINGGGEFCGSNSLPFRAGALVNNGGSLGRGFRILNVEELTTDIFAVIGYTWSTSTFNYDVSTSLQLYAYALSAKTEYSGSSSVASGSYSVASGSYSVASGSSSVASGIYSVASGSSSVASGSSSVASGIYSVASGINSICLGGYCMAIRNYQTVIGLYNAKDSSSAFVIGWGGGETSRKNVFTVGTDGSTKMSGSLEVAKNSTLSGWLEVAGTLNAKSELNITGLLSANGLANFYKQTTFHNEIVLQGDANTTTNYSIYAKGWDYAEKVHLIGLSTSGNELIVGHNWANNSELVGSGQNLLLFAGWSGGTIFAKNDVVVDSTKTLTAATQNVGLLQVKNKLQFNIGTSTTLMDIYNYDNDYIYPILAFDTGEESVTIGHECITQVNFMPNVMFDNDVQVDGLLNCTLDANVDGIATVGELIIGTPNLGKSVRLYYDDTNDCLRVDKGVASDSFVSAKEVDTNTSTIEELQARILALEEQVALLTSK